MYHIKSDKRSQASAAEIARGLQECLKTVPFPSVTVTDIHRVTGISRATFYRLFDNMEDVLHYQLDRMVESRDLSYSSIPFSSKKMLEETIAMGFDNHDFLKALVDNGRFDLLFRYTERNFQALDQIHPFFPENMGSMERQYVIANLSMTLVANLITWSRNGQKETAAQIAGYLQEYGKLLTLLLEE